MGLSYESPIIKVIIHTIAIFHRSDLFFANHGRTNQIRREIGLT
jgi:hypothetical protein